MWGEAGFRLIRGAAKPWRSSGFPRIGDLTRRIAKKWKRMLQACRIMAGVLYSCMGEVTDEGTRPSMSASAEAKA